MHPLTPENLLIRHSPVDDNQWLDASAGSEQKGAAAIPLERFQALEHVLRDHPLTVDPYLELARIYLQCQRWNDAKRVLDLAHDRFETNEDVNFLREESQIARSLQLFSIAQKEYAAEPTQLTRESLDRSNLELNVLREKVCRSRLERHPEQIELNLPLATALENLGSRDEAIQCLQSAVAKPNLRAAAALQLGHTFARAKRIPEALSAYRRAALHRVPPPSVEIRQSALLAAADLAQQSGMIDSATRYVELLVELQPNDVELRQRYDALRATPL